MIKNYTDVKPWSVEDIINALGENPPKKEKIIVPKFQRTLVWTDKQRKLLIDSIKNGMPIGALLLYKVGETNGITEYQLIDGLQRVTTLKKYHDRPTDFYDEVNLPNNLIIDIVAFLSEKGISISGEDIKKWIVEWIKSINGFEETAGFSSYKVAKFLDEKIKDKFEEELDKDEIDEFVHILQPHLRKIKEESDISNFKIPVIIYTGDQSNLPMIFERVNSKGTQLNKYQIFAATWSAYPPIQINNEEIIDKIKSKYDALIDEGFEIENYDSINFYASKLFTYFEYLFGLGKLMVDRYPLLFRSTSAEHEADSIGFNTVAICLNHDLKSLATLPEQLRKVDIDDLEKKIFSSIDVANNILRPYIGLRANKKNGKEYPIIHSEFQMVSIIGKVFHSMYELKQNGNGMFEIQENIQWEDLRKKLEKNIPFHYLHDIIKGFWSGTGDKKAMEKAHSDKYEKQITKDMWEAILNEWHENEKSKKEKTRESINKVSVLFLKYIYTHLIPVKEEFSTVEFEVDHVIPFAKLKKIASKVDGLPISAIGNLALIEKKLNRGKKDKTFYEYFDDMVSKGCLAGTKRDEEIKKVEKYTFTNRDMLNFITSLDQNNIILFYNYLDGRFNRIKEMFYELNGIL